MKRHKPSGAQNRKLKQQRTKALESSKSFMTAFIKGSLNSENNETQKECEFDSSNLSLDINESNITVVNELAKDDDLDGNCLKADDSNPSIQLMESNAIGAGPSSSSNNENEPKETLIQHDNDNFDKMWLSDIGSWPLEISQKFRDTVVMQGTYQLQNKDSTFPADESGRSLHKNWFEKTLKNGEKVNRSWMCFSPSKKAVFCFCCVLFPQRNMKSSFNNESGFAVWRKLNPRIQDHENSPAHRIAFMEWKSLERRLKQGSVIDNTLQQQILEQSRIWREVLERIIATIQTLAQQNLALRGHRESVLEETEETTCSSGNFLALLQYLAKFDPVMRAHFQSVSNNPRHLSYLSPRIQNEIINFLGDHVRSNIITSCKRAKYFSIIFDSTPDTSHDEQMSQVIRFVEVKQSSVEIKECFIDFISIKDKTADGIAEVIKKKLEEDGLNFADCRGQSYDNQATMAGIHTGVQQRLKELNHQAVFVPCDNHSLNLVGVHAAHVNVCAVTFFGTVQQVYAFFSSLTHRWSVLKEHVSLLVKGHSDTRWSSKAEAVKALSSQLDGVLHALEKLRDCN